MLQLLPSLVFHVEHRGGALSTLIDSDTASLPVFRCQMPSCGQRSSTGPVALWRLKTPHVICDSALFSSQVSDAKLWTAIGRGQDVPPDAVMHGLGTATKNIYSKSLKDFEEVQAFLSLVMIVTGLGRIPHLCHIASGASPRLAKSGAATLFTA